MKDPSAIKCPTCGKRGDWFAGAYGPFCSRRCKLLDLGQWFEEEHRISQPLGPADPEQIEDLPANETPDDDQDDTDRR